MQHLMVWPEIKESESKRRVGDLFLFLFFFSPETEFHTAAQPGV